MRRIRYRLEEITKERVVPRRSPSLKRVYLKMDVDKIRALGVKVAPEPLKWRRTLRYTREGNCFPINCVAFALAMYDCKVFRDNMIDDYCVWSRPRDASTELAEGLLDTFHWRRRKAQPKEGDLAIYCDRNKRVKHMGLVLGDGSVRSKWGILPAIFDHPVWHVPLSYGVAVEYYHPVPLAKAETVYKQLTT